MPDASSRSWFIKVSQMFSNKSSETDILNYASKLGISDPDDLLGCLQDTSSNTARQIIRLLYSPVQLATMSGTEVPIGTRQLIRGVYGGFKPFFNFDSILCIDFCELHRGPISSRKFNEAINGVFRAKKHIYSKSSIEKQTIATTNGRKSTEVVLDTSVQSSSNRGENKKSDENIDDNSSNESYEL